MQDQNEQDDFHVLCCDTSGDVVRVSWTVYRNNQEPFDEARMSYLLMNNRRRSEYLGSAVEHVRTVVEGDYKALKCICYVVGPGSFTGLRNALAFIKGIVVGTNSQGIFDRNDVYIVGIRIHDVIAYHYHQYGNIDTPYSLLVVTDARSNRYYAALYTADIMTKKAYNTVPIRDCTIDDITIDMYSETVPTYVIGSAAHSFVKAISSQEKTRFVYSSSFVEHACTVDILDSIKQLGFYYRKHELYRITELSEPLYIRAQV